MVLICIRNGCFLKCTDRGIDNRLITDEMHIACSLYGKQEVYFSDGG